MFTIMQTGTTYIVDASNSGNGIQTFEELTEALEYIADQFEPERKITAEGKEEVDPW